MAIVAKRLRARKHRVEILTPSFGKGDLVVDDVATVSVHAARPRIRQQVIGGRTYAYRQVLWNTHWHGQPMRHRPDVFVFVRTDTPSEAFVVPQAAHRSLSITLMADTDVRDRRSRYFDYLNAWGVVRDAVAEKRRT